MRWTLNSMYCEKIDVCWKITLELFVESACCLFVWISFSRILIRWLHMCNMRGKRRKEIQNPVFTFNIEGQTMLSQSKLPWRSNLFFNATKIVMRDSLNNQSKTLKYMTADASTWHLTLSNKERSRSCPRFKFNLIHDQLEENLPYTWNDFNG